MEKGVTGKKLWNPRGFTSREIGCQNLDIVVVFDAAVFLYLFLFAVEVVIGLAFYPKCLLLQLLQLEKLPLCQI